MQSGLRTGIFFTGWVTVTLVLGIGALPLLLRRRWAWFAARLWVAITLRWLAVSCGIRTRVMGQPASGLIASKHQSALDTLLLWRALKNPAFVLKRELYWIPVFGWYLWRSGQIAINRGDRREAMHAILQQAQKVRDAGRSIVIFPEGTRVLPGDEQPFHAGIARVSAALEEAVTPVALNAGYFWPKRTLKKFPGMAVLEFLPAQAACDASFNEWLAQLQHRINARSRQLNPRD